MKHISIESVKVGQALKVTGLQKHPTNTSRINVWYVIQSVTQTHIDYLEVDRMGRKLGEVVHATRSSFEKTIERRGLLLDPGFNTHGLIHSSTLPAMKILCTTPVRASDAFEVFPMPDGESFTEAGIKVLNTKVTAGFGSALTAEFIAAAKKHLGVVAKAAPEMGTQALVLVYDWDTLETSDPKALEDKLRRFYAACQMADTGTGVDKQSDDELTEMQAASKSHLTTLMGGNEFQLMLWDDDATFDVRITTNDATIAFIMR